MRAISKCDRYKMQSAYICLFIVYLLVPVVSAHSTLIGYDIYIEIQVIKDLRSLIGDHDIDHFFHDHELIAITRENDHDLLNFVLSRSRSFGHLDSYIYSPRQGHKHKFVTKFLGLTLFDQECQAALGWVSIWMGGWVGKI